MVNYVEFPGLAITLPADADITPKREISTEEHNGWPVEAQH
jgi:hypothetical protein